MAADLTAYDSVLKEDYGPAIVEQLYNATVMLSRLKRSTEFTQGKEVKIPIHIARTPGIGARAENQQLPAAGKQGYRQTTFSVKYNFGRIKVTEQLIKASRNNKGAFIQGIDGEIKGMARDFSVDINRQLFGDGRGTLATTAAMGSVGNTVTVNSIRYLPVGTVVDIVRTDAGNIGTVRAQNRTVTAVNTTTPSVTLSGGTFQTLATDVIVRNGSFDLEMNGLANIVNNTGILQNLNPAVAGNELWVANVLRNPAAPGTPRAISEILMQTAEDVVEEAAGKTSLVVTTYGVRRSYLNLLASLRRFHNTLDLKAGFKALDYNGKPLVVDRDCQLNRAYFLDESHVNIYQMMEPEWMQLDGAVLSRVSGEAAYEAVYEWFAELGTDMRRSNAVLMDIIES